MTELLLSIMGFYFNEVTQVPAMPWLPHEKGIVLPVAVIKELRKQAKNLLSAYLVWHR